MDFGNISTFPHSTTTTPRVATTSSPLKTLRGVSPQGLACLARLARPARPVNPCGDTPRKGFRYISQIDRMIDVLGGYSFLRIFRNEFSFCSQVVLWWECPHSIPTQHSTLKPPNTQTLGFLRGVSLRMRLPNSTETKRLRIYSQRYSQTISLAILLARYIQRTRCASTAFLLNKFLNRTE